jgi:hypothetical protein
MCPVWLSEVEKDNRIRIEDFCGGRKNKVPYTLFYTKFVPAVVGPELFRQRIKDTTTTDLCTASDEAFALLLLENSYARWENIYDNNGGIPSQRRGDTKRTFESDIEAKYTRGGIKLSSNKESQKRKGWTPEGIKRFNTLFAKVNKDRKKRPTFDKKVIKQLREDQHQHQGKKKRKHETILAAHSLWDDDDLGIDNDDEDRCSSSGGSTV